VSIIGLVRLPIERRMTDEDIHIGKFAERFCCPEVVPFVIDYSLVNLTANLCRSELASANTFFFTTRE
jgi:hypothetical protein